MSKIPKAPPLPGPKTGVTAQTGKGFLNASDNKGAHNRSQHVGLSGQQLKNRITSGEVTTGTATSFLTKHDQNKAAASVMNTQKAVNTRNQVASGGVNNKKATDANFNASAIGARTSPIMKVAQKQPDGSVKTFNAKVTNTKMVLKKATDGTVKAQTTYGTKVGMVPLPQPSPGPSLKPTTKANVTSIADGKAGLRKVGAPAEKGPNLGDQKRFRGVTKNAKPGNVTTKKK